MKKQDLLNFLDDDLLDRLYGFCYARTNDSYEAEELCSDILFHLLRVADGEGEIENVYPFIWKIARNVYADFADKRRKHAERYYEGDAEALLRGLADDAPADDTEELLTAVFRRIAYLTAAYRNVMIMFYLEGVPVPEIAKRLDTSEGAVRQRLFSARQKIRSEVDTMTETYHKPVALDTLNFHLWGAGSPSWGDPRSVCTRMLSRHIVWLCRRKPMSASEIAAELNVPTVYVEEELEILRAGTNGEYGFLRRLESGKYTVNFVLLDADAIEKMSAVYTERLPKICRIISDYIAAHQNEYLAFPYFNRKVDLNLIIWQQIIPIASAFSGQVDQILSERYFADVPEVKRPFHIFGYVDNGRRYGGSGWDGVGAQNICGFSEIFLENIYISRIKKHFSCEHNVASDPQLQLALRAISGLPIAALDEKEKEHAAKATQCGYLYRDGDMLYTKILVSRLSDHDRLFAISDGLRHGYFEEDAATVATKMAELIREAVPADLRGEWRYANSLASMTIVNSIAEALIRDGILTPPEKGIGAEGCWMSVSEPMPARTDA